MARFSAKMTCLTSSWIDFGIFSQFLLGPNLVAFGPNLVAFGPNLVAFGPNLVAFGPNLVAFRVITY